MPIPEITVDPIAAGVSVDDPHPSISVLWDRAIQTAVIAESPGPTIASRAYSIVHTSIFEAWAAYDPTAVGTAFGDAMQQADVDITEANKAEAMSYAAYSASVALFPDQIAVFDAVMAELGYSVDLQDVDSPAALVGIPAGAGVVASRMADGSNQLGGYADTTGYAPVNISPDEQVSIEHWTPEFVPIDTGENLQSFLTPHWGWVTPFAEENADLAPPPPQPFFVDSVRASLDLQAQTITLEGLADGATRRDFRELRKDLRDAFKGTKDWPEVKGFIKDVRKSLRKDTDVDPITLDVSKKLIGPVINPEFISQAEDIVAASAALTMEEKMIAEFWEDGGGTSFPPGTWMTFGQFVSARDDHSLDDDAQLFFALSNAVFDAGTATWRAKVVEDYARPVAVIRDLGELGLLSEWGTDHMGNEGYVIEAYAGDGLGTKTILAENFITYQKPTGDPSPPFAEYTSGHSAFSAAGAEVLELFTGSQEFGGSVELDFLLFETEQPVKASTMEWATFDEAAEGAGVSRIYGAIHFEEGDMHGRTLGTEVGANVYETAQSYINGTADDFAFV